MSRPFKLEIAESEAELKKRLQFAREAIHLSGAENFLAAYAGKTVTRENSIRVSMRSRFFNDA